MEGTRSDIIAGLEKKILSLQGFKPPRTDRIDDAGLGVINKSFPNGRFAIGAVHEFIVKEPKDLSNPAGFISGILGSLTHNGGIVIWIGNFCTIFPPALQQFGVSPSNMIFIQLHKEKEILWAMEEALRCEGLAAVIGYLPGLSFTASRRFQLAVEKSQVTCFILRPESNVINKTACVTQWEITSLPSRTQGSMPGIGYPRWKVELLKVRNGTPGQWQVEFISGKFRQVIERVVIQPGLKRKTG